MAGVDAYPPDVSARASLLHRVRLASGAFAAVAGLVKDGALPLSFASVLFESKVGGALAPGRWLYAIDGDAGSTLDSLLDTWAFLGRSSRNRPSTSGRSTSLNM